MNDQDYIRYTRGAIGKFKDEFNTDNLYIDVANLNWHGEQQTTVIITTHNGFEIQTLEQLQEIIDILEHSKLYMTGEKKVIGLEPSRRRKKQERKTA